MIVSGPCHGLPQHDPVLIDKEENSNIHLKPRPTQVISRELQGKI